LFTADDLQLLVMVTKPLGLGAEAKARFGSEFLHSIERERDAFNLESEITATPRYRFVLPI
jgi:hypothetical protein